MSEENACQIDLDTLPDNSHYAPKHIPIEKLKTLRAKGLSYSQVATIAGCSKANVLMRLNGIEAHDEEIDEYKESRADTLAGLQLRLISHITEDKLKKAPVGSLVLAVAQLYDKERTERGLANAINVTVMADLLEAVRQMRDK